MVEQAAEGLYVQDWDCTRQDRQEYRQDKTATGWRQRQSMLIEELVANTDRVRLAFIHGAGEMTVRCARYLAGEENDAGSSAKSRACSRLRCCWVEDEGWIGSLLASQPVRQ